MLSLSVYVDQISLDCLLSYVFIADFIGHIKLVNEQALNESLVLDEVEIASDRRILVHVQTHE